jgi:hypothetical protein
LKVDSAIRSTFDLFIAFAAVNPDIQAIEYFKYAMEKFLPAGSSVEAQHFVQFLQGACIFGAFSKALFYRETEFKLVFARDSMTKLMADQEVFVHYLCHFLQRHQETLELVDLRIYRWCRAFANYHWSDASVQMLLETLANFKKIKILNLEEVNLSCENISFFSHLLENSNVEYVHLSQDLLEEGCKNQILSLQHTREDLKIFIYPKVSTNRYRPNFNPALKISPSEIKNIVFNYK